MTENKKQSSGKTVGMIIFVLWSLALYIAAGFLQRLPEQRFGDSDLGLFLTLTLYPCLFFLHGIITALLWEKRKYFIPVLLNFVIMALIFFVAGTGAGTGILGGFVGGLLYTIVMCIGILAVCAVRLLFRCAVRASQSIGNWEKRRNHNV